MEVSLFGLGLAPLGNGSERMAMRGVDFPNSIFGHVRILMEVGPGISRQATFDCFQHQPGYRYIRLGGVVGKSEAPLHDSGNI